MSCLSNISATPPAGCKRKLSDGYTYYTFTTGEIFAKYNDVIGGDEVIHCVARVDISEEEGTEAILKKDRISRAATFMISTDTHSGSFFKDTEEEEKTERFPFFRNECCAKGGEQEMTKEERLCAMYKDIDRVLAEEKAGGYAVPNYELYYTKESPTKEKTRKFGDDWPKGVTGMSDEELADRENEDSDVPPLEEEEEDEEEKEIRKKYGGWLREFAEIPDEEVAKEHARMKKVLADYGVSDLEESVMEDCE